MNVYVTISLRYLLTRAQDIEVRTLSNLGDYYYYFR